MKYRINRIFGAILLAITFFSFSCTEYDEIDTEEIEQEIFDEWMAKYYPELVANKQENGGYYIDIVTVGDTTGKPINDTLCWVEYDLTGYDLYGNVTITRNDVIAWQQGTFSTATHYAPYFRISYNNYLDYDEDDFVFPLECTQLAFCSELTVGNRDDVLLYNGAEFTLYSPSSITSTDGTNGSAGYGGQYTLSTMPFICKIKVTNVVTDAAVYGYDLVNSFAISNGGLTITPESLNMNFDEDKVDDDDYDTSTDQTLSNDTNAWTNGTKYIPYVYLNNSYTLNLDGVSFNYINPYTSTVPDSPYVDGLAALDKEINEALELRFSNEYDKNGEQVGDDGIAYVWYICRHLDGFIVDTNIDEVKEIIYGSVDSTGSMISYDVDSDKDSYIGAWYYTIPSMYHGSWCAIVTSADYAYGSDGTGGSTSSSSSSSYYNYYNYYNSYYSGYSSYSSYYSNSYYSSYYDTSSSTTSTTSTEILPYAPLLFQIFVEVDAYDDDDDDE